MAEDREQELAANLRDVRQRIAAACASARRDPAEITLVAVTKTWPAADVCRLARLGVTEIGENRDQEAAPKAAEVGAAGVDVRWHFVGGLQRNKCASVVRYAAMVQSVDSVRLAQALDQAAHRAGRTVEVLVQVSIDGDPARGGALSVAGTSTDDADRSLHRVLSVTAAAPSLVLCGLMAVAPLGWEPERAFATLADLRARVIRDYPDAVALSAGMSGDVEQAIGHGATHVRLGTALLGNRSALM